MTSFLSLSSPNTICACRQLSVTYRFGGLFRSLLETKIRIVGIWIIICASVRVQSIDREFFPVIGLQPAEQRRLQLTVRDGYAVLASVLLCA